ncbi:hypothetical protein GCM10023196_060140 [Actinoallomurus vinaceus]|uniref:DUF1232 domain-containing protein n=1 Tax=Actinoallomurus vinaceus TaxID=1080074 RepID=A0ABP8UKN1_9ACTN
MASAGYNFVRWLGGAIAPYAASRLGDGIDPALPYYADALCCLAGMAVLYARRHHLRTLDRADIDHTFQDARVLVRH